MKNKSLSIIVVAFIVLVGSGFLVTALLGLGAASFLTITSSSGTRPTPVVEYEAPVKSYQPVTIDQVAVEVGVGSPIPVQVHISGSLPDTCAQIERVEHQQDPSSFTITLSTLASNAEGCIQDALPFKMSLPLNVVGRPSGTYPVQVNGVRATFTLQ